jgi:hypothetical protein
MSCIAAIFRFYSAMVIGTLALIPVAYCFAPLWEFAQTIPAEYRDSVLQTLWLSMVAIVAGWLIDDWLPLAAAPEERQGRPSLLRLQDLAPWLQATSVSECEAASPALSPPLKSLPAPEHGSAN